MENSLLKPYSIGIVLEDKEGDSDMIKVIPSEQLSLFSGSLNEQKLKYEVNSPDAQGVKRESHVEGGVEIVAKWIFSSGNRLTAPNVKKNESVLIYRFADTDEFYWQTFMREPSLRRREHVHYAFSNLPDGVNPYDKNSSYWFEISTREKHIHLHTAKNNGEPFEYDIKLDTSDGNFIVTDDINNYIKIDSKNRVITIHHTSNHVIEIGDDYILSRDNLDNEITINNKEDRIELNHHNDSTIHIDTNMIDARDRNNNNIKIDTANDNIEVVNSRGSDIRLNKEDIVINCRSFTLNSSTDVTINTSLTNIYSSTEMNITTPITNINNNLTNINSNTEMNITTPITNINSNTEVNVNSPHTHINGGFVELTGTEITANGEDLTYRQT